MDRRAEADRRVAQLDVADDRRVEKRRGRPKGDPSERMDVRLPQPLFDAVCRDALRRGIPASTLVRRIVAQHFLSGGKAATAPTP
jgi:hypothetical protein